jgi:hypothetical protein
MDVDLVVARLAIVGGNQGGGHAHLSLVGQV